MEKIWIPRVKRAVQRLEAREADEELRSYWMSMSVTDPL